MKIRTVVIDAISVLFIGSLVFAGYKANLHGVTINGVTVKLTDLTDYKEIVESSMHVPKIITDGTEDMERCIRWTLDGEYSFKMQDMFGLVSLPISCDVDRTRLEMLLQDMNDGLMQTTDAYIDMETKEVIPEQYGEQIDISSALDAICGAAESWGIATLSDYKTVPSVFSGDLQDGVDGYWKHRNWTIGYAGTDILVEVPEDAIELHSDGTFEVLSYDFLDGYIDSAASAFDTVGKNNPFVAHGGSTVTISGGTLGNKVDKKVEKETLIFLFNKAESQPDRMPIYSTHVDGGFDTYVEVSLEEQHVWFYKDSELIMDSDCVSGTKDTSRETPTGMWYMDVVMPGKMLYPSGESKGTWVDRWMRFTPDGCGLHDATWRSKFGGSIYTYSGSHGCVNLPPRFAYDLYEYAYTGMPVIVY